MTRRVHATYWPERLGTIVAEGPEVSEIKWDDGSTSDHYLTNGCIVDVGPPASFGGGGPTLRVINPRGRKIGSKGAARFAEMMAWVKANPQGSLDELFKATSYTKSDYAWDVKQRNITIATDWS